MIKNNLLRRIGFLVVAIIALAGCANVSHQSLPANATKTGCCAKMVADDGCGCCKNMGMCPMSKDGSSVPAAHDASMKSAKPNCCAKKAGGEACGCCKGMGMCPMSKVDTNAIVVKGSDSKGAKPGCCAGMASDGMSTECCCKGMNGDSIAKPSSSDR